MSDILPKVTSAIYDAVTGVFCWETVNGGASVTSSASGRASLAAVAQSAASGIVSAAKRWAIAVGILEPDPDRGFTGAVFDIVADVCNFCKKIATDASSGIGSVAIAFGITEPEPDRGITGAVLDVVSYVANFCKQIAIDVVIAIPSVAVSIARLVGSTAGRVASIGQSVASGIVTAVDAASRILTSTASIPRKTTVLAILLLSGFAVFKISAYFNKSFSRQCSCSRNEEWCDVHGSRRRQIIDHYSYLDEEIHLSPRRVSQINQQQEPQESNQRNGRRRRSRRSKKNFFNDECPICLDPLRMQAQLLPCGHGLHYSCFDELSESVYGRNCPLCRQQFYM